MKINRHNYEEFFILYMDNELSDDDRRQVEGFAHLHPDLKEELDNLLQYKLVPDTEMECPDKAELLKGTGDLKINLANYEEWLLSYVDNELDPSENEMVLSFLAANPQLGPKLVDIQKAKLEPVTIQFPYKESLYRREERRIPVTWWRMAAAAIFVLALGISAVMLVNRKSPAANTEVAKNTDRNIQAKPEIKKPVEENATNQELASSTDKKENNSDRVAEIKNTRKKSIDPLPSVNKNEEAAVVNNDIKPSNNLPQPINNNNAIISLEKDPVAVNTPPDEIRDLKITLAPSNVTSTDVHPSDYKTASYPATTDQDLSQEERGGKKNKLRGIFRKISRTFEKRTNIDPATQDNKLLVAGFSINMK